MSLASAQAGNILCGQDPEAIQRAARLLLEGGAVAIPTETVYGLAANVFDANAVVGVFALKGRPTFDPLIVHVPDLAAAERLAIQFPPRARKLAERFWPGPLTLVVDKAPSIPDIVTAGLPRVGLRVPVHPMALALLREVQVPLAAPSANPFGKTSPTSAQHVVQDFQGRVPVLDGGPCTHGIESTVVLVPEGDELPVLLRPGAVPLDALSEVVGTMRQGDHEQTLRPPAPGMLARHYATDTPMHFDPQSLSGTRIGWLGLGRPSSADRFAAVESLSEQGDLVEAAAHLFGAMRRLDALGLDAIWAESVPDTGIGRAINDRLRRACARTSATS